MEEAALVFQIGWDALYRHREGDSGQKINIFGGDSIGHCEKKDLIVIHPVVYAISLYNTPEDGLLKAETCSVYVTCNMW
jgi:hypothetical protein